MEFLLVSDVARMLMILMTLMMVMMLMLMNMFSLTQLEMVLVLIFIIVVIIIFPKMRKEIPQVCVPQFNSSLILVDFLIRLFRMP